MFTRSSDGNITSDTRWCALYEIYTWHFLIFINIILQEKVCWKVGKNNYIIKYHKLKHTVKNQEMFLNPLEIGPRQVIEVRSLKVL